MYVLKHTYTTKSLKIKLKYFKYYLQAKFLPAILFFMYKNLQI